MKTMLALAALPLVTGAALAEERTVSIRDAPGREAVEVNCGACHSLDYIRTNAPFMTPQVWTAEVNKMINAFGAPIAPEDAKTIIDYLIRNYGKPG
jgi:sulfite dehydrogenase (cytochrome) subunit B